jgi:hypothetical protein
VKPRFSEVDDRIRTMGNNLRANAGKPIEFNMENYGKVVYTIKEVNPINLKYLDALIPMFTMQTGGLLLEMAMNGGISSRLKDYDLSRWKHNVTLPLDLENYIKNYWRQNQNEWYVDYPGHTLFGVWMADFFRRMGYNEIEAFCLTFISDLYWELVIEGECAPPEWNDFVTTGIVGNFIGSVVTPKFTNAQPVIGISPMGPTVNLKFSNRDREKPTSLTLGAGYGMFGREKGNIRFEAGLTYKNLKLNMFLEGDKTKNPGKIGASATFSL